MSYPELNQYISKRLSQGATKDIIFEELLPNNWTKTDVESAFGEIEAGQSLSFANTKKETPMPTIQSEQKIPQDIIPQTITPKIENQISQNPNTSIEVSVGHSIVLKVTAIVAVIIVLAVAGTLAYAKWGATSIEKVLAKTIEATRDAKSISFDFAMGIKSESFSVDSNLKMKGKIDDNNSLEKAELELDLSFDAGLFGSENVSLKALVPNQENLYLSLSKIPSMLGMFTSTDLSVIEGKWIKIPATETKDVLEDLPINEISDKEEYEKNLKTLSFAIKEFKPVIAKNIGTQEIAGTKTKGYEILIDSDKTIEFLKYVSKEIGEEMSNTEIESFKLSLEEIKKGKIEIWIGSRDDLIYKLSYTAVGVNMNSGTTLSPDLADITLSLTINGYDKDFEVAEPTEYMEFSEFMEIIMGDSKVSSIQSLLMGTQAFAEISYDEYGNYNAVCGANKAKQDPDIAEIIGRIKSSDYTMKVVCGKPLSGNASAWAISAFSPQIGGYCVDNTRTLREISRSINATTVACPLN